MDEKIQETVQKGDSYSLHAPELYFHEMLFCTEFDLDCAVFPELLKMVCHSQLQCFVCIAYLKLIAECFMGVWPILLCAF